nr:autotransporter outer membrane beta-barrel domain-containing protein [uncultured Pseudodesulfovibrio sp.]
MPSVCHYPSSGRIVQLLLLPLSLLFVLSLCLPVQADNFVTYPAADRTFISGNGTTLFFMNYSGDNLTLQPVSGGARQVVSKDACKIFLNATYDGSALYADYSQGAYFYSKANNASYALRGTGGKIPTALSITGLSPDRTALVGSNLYNTSTLWISPEDWSSTSPIVEVEISSNSQAKAVSSQNNGTWKVVEKTPTTSRVVTVNSNGTLGTNVELADSFGLNTIPIISGDGSTVAMNKFDAGFFIWDSNTGIKTEVPVMSDYTETTITGMDNNGSMIIGHGRLSSGYTRAIYWSGSGSSYAYHNLQETLEENGVSFLNTDYLMEATGITSDGSIIVGKAHLNSKVCSFLANINPNGPIGVITTDQLNQSLATMGQVGSAVSGMGQISMSRLGNVAGGQGAHFHVTTPGTETAGGGAERGLSSGDEMPGSMDLWVIGSVGSNIELNGDDLGLRGGVGLTWDNGNEWRFGGGVFGDMRDLKTNHGGDQSIQAIGPGVFAVYSPEQTGFEFRLSALWQSVALDLTRGYANGAGSATSSGSTDANVFGLSGRVQWTKNMTDSFDLTPFAEYTWQTTHIDSYSESDGPFPASFDSRTETSNSIRAGLRADAAIFDKVGTWAWLAWDHRFEDSSAGMGGSTIGLGAFTYPGAKLDQDWADAGVGASWDITERLEATSSLGFAMGCDDETVPDLTATMGLSYQLW